jgi:hypothetical protein
VERHALIQRESDFQQAVIDLAHVYRWRVAHFRPAKTEQGWRTPVQADGKGFPDLVLVKLGRCLFAELKSERGRLSLEQKAWLSDLTLCSGVECHVWRPSDWNIINATLKGAA